MSDVVIVRDTEENGELNQRIYMYCPGCEDIHAVDKNWMFDGNKEKPTIAPSILVDYGSISGKSCHSFVVEGKWQFLADSTHALSGKTVEMVPVPLNSKGVLWP